MYIEQWWMGVISAHNRVIDFIITYMFYGQFIYI